MNQVTKKLTILFFLLVSIVLTSCGQVSSEDINPEIINANYSALYDDEMKETRVDGTFTIDGLTYVTLDGASKLLIDGQASKLNTTIIGQISYERKYKNSSKRNFELKFIDKNTSEYINEITLPSNFSLKAESRISTSEDLEISYEIADSQDQLSRLNVIVSGASEVLSFYLNESNLKGYIKINKEELQQIQGSILKVKVCRERSRRLINHPGDAYSSSSFCKLLK